MYDAPNEPRPMHFKSLNRPPIYCFSSAGVPPVMGTQGSFSLHIVAIVRVMLSGINEWDLTEEVRLWGTGDGKGKGGKGEVIEPCQNVAVIKILPPYTRPHVSAR